MFNFVILSVHNQCVTLSAVTLSQCWDTLSNSVKFLQRVYSYACQLKSHGWGHSYFWWNCVKVINRFKNNWILTSCRRRIFPNTVLVLDQDYYLLVYNILEPLCEIKYLIVLIVWRGFIQSSHLESITSDLSQWCSCNIYL